MSPAYGWQRSYEEAVLETDRSRLPILIRVARAAIDALGPYARKSPELSGLPLFLLDRES